MKLKGEKIKDPVEQLGWGKDLCLEILSGLVDWVPTNEPLTAGHMILHSWPIIQHCGSSDGTWEDLGIYSQVHWNPIFDTQGSLAQQAEHQRLNFCCFFPSPGRARAVGAPKMMLYSKYRRFERETNIFWWGHWQTASIRT